MSSQKIRATLNHLALAPVRTCRGMASQVCCLCSKSITTGDEYRDAGKKYRAHVACFQAAVQENR